MGKSNKKSKKNVTIENSAKFIIPPTHKKSINAAELEQISSIDYPLFSFKYLQIISFPEQRDVKFFHHFIERLHKYSTLTWLQMAVDKKHGYGFEYLSQSVMKHALPNAITPDVDLMVLRSSNDNRALVGFRKWQIFYVIFIEAQFNDIYDHK